MAKFRDMGKFEKIIYLFSILDIFDAVSVLILGILAIVASVSGAAGDETAVVVGATIGLIIVGIASLITGVLGIRAAKDPTKIKPVYILSIIVLALNAVGLASSFFIEGEGPSRYVVNLAMSGLMFYAAWNINKRVS